MPETPLPEHAIAEINAAKGQEKASLRRWWDSWATVGDVKMARDEALAQVIAAEEALYAAPVDERPRRLDDLRAATATLEKADAAVAKDIDRHKAVK